MHTIRQNNAYDCSQDHTVEFETVQLVSGQRLLNVWLDGLLDEVLCEEVCIGPYLFENLESELGTN